MTPLCTCQAQRILGTWWSTYKVRSRRKVQTKSFFIHYKLDSQSCLAMLLKCIFPYLQCSVVPKPSYALGGFICTFSFLISLSLTLQTSKFRNQFTISSKYFDMACYLKRETYSGPISFEVQQNDI